MIRFDEFLPKPYLFNLAKVVNRNCAFIISDITSLFCSFPLYDKDILKTFSLIFLVFISAVFLSFCSYGFVNVCLLCKTFIIIRNIPVIHLLACDLRLCRGLNIKARQQKQSIYFGAWISLYNDFFFGKWRHVIFIIFV